MNDVRRPVGGSDDPFARLGLDRGASLEQVRLARRRLAFDAHPDRGGDQAAMQELNAAFEACVAHLTGRRPLPDPVRDQGPAGSPTQGAARRPVRRRIRPEPRRQRVEHDTPSFTISLLPAPAFEALLLVGAVLGEVLDDDPPYLLECLLHDPATCWCRLELVPDAGSSTVSLTVAAVDADGARPPAEEVRDRWVEELNRLDGPL